jgi:hypothetical protein
VDGDNGFGRMQGRFGLHGKFHLQEEALQYAIAGKRELFTASWTLAASFRKNGRVEKFKMSSSTGMLVDLYDPKGQTELLELVAGLITTRLDQVAEQNEPSIMLSIDIANETRDKFLAHPVLSYTFLNFHGFRASDFLS